MIPAPTPPDAGAGSLRVDLHAHTSYSPDARMSPAELLERAEEAGLSRVAITDHGEIEGAVLAHSMDPERVIIGEEIRCRCRTELLGLFLRERIPQGLPVEQVVEMIREQGGLICAPHPYAYVARPRWHARKALGVADLVETFNSRAFLTAWNRCARAAARVRGLPAVACSDAHFPHELGRAFTRLPGFVGAAGLLAAARYGRPVGCQVGSPLVHVASVAWKAVRSGAQVAAPRHVPGTRLGDLWRSPARPTR